MFRVPAGRYEKTSAALSEGNQGRGAKSVVRSKSYDIVSVWTTGLAFFLVVASISNLSTSHHRGTHFATKVAFFFHFGVITFGA